MSKQLKRILIGSNGGLTGTYLAKKLREIKSVELFGSDSSEVNCGKFFVDKQVSLPKSMDKDFITELIRCIRNNNIDYYLPTHSKEIRRVSECETEIKGSCDAKFIVSPIDTYKALEDKDASNVNLKHIGIPVPEIIEDYNHLYPIFMKKKNGSGSFGACVVENETLHRAYEESTSECVFFEYIKGDEYTCDCLFDFDGNLIGSYERRRVKTIGGAVSITEGVGTTYGIDYIKLIAKSWKLCGCVNFQYIVRDGVPFFTDINLRYPSGGLPLTVAAGLDIPKLLIRILDGEDIDAGDIVLNKKRMYRYFEEIYEDVE